MHVAKYKPPANFLQAVYIYIYIYIYVTQINKKGTYNLFTCVVLHAHNIITVSDSAIPKIWSLIYILW